MCIYYVQHAAICFYVIAFNFHKNPMNWFNCADEETGFREVTQLVSNVIIKGHTASK